MLLIVQKEFIFFWQQFFKVERDDLHPSRVSVHSTQVNIYSSSQAELMLGVFTQIYYLQSLNFNYSPVLVFSSLLFFSCFLSSFSRPQILSLGKSVSTSRGQFGTYLTCFSNISTYRENIKKFRGIKISTLFSQ